jgi:uncharacterized protein YprB with RNaseH-like and TPR domain
MMGRLDIFDKMRGAQKRSLIHKDSRHANLEAVKKKLDGTIIEEGPSSILKVEYSFPAVYTHGNTDLVDVRNIDPEYLGVLLPVFPGTGNISSEDLLIFDLETTGLSGGAGTYVFMAGFLRVENERISAVQYFLNDLSSEKLFLTKIKDQLKSGPILVSYNGKSFDYNILRNRFIINGLNPAETYPTHLDLLYTARRIWRDLFPDFSLQTVERWALEFKREGDIPGHMVPEIYFQYLRGREVSDDICGVFTHNKNDIVSLLAVLLKQLSIIGYCTRNDGLGGNEPPVKFNPVSLSDMLLSSNYHEEAKNLLENHTDDTEALKKLGLMYKRNRMHREALVLFKKLIQKTENLSDYIFACVEMAKLYEHRLKDFENAILYTERVWNRVRRQDYFYPDHARVFLKDRELIEKRLDRLKKKRSRNETQSH